MRKKLLTLGVLLATLLPKANADVDPNFYIYICFGQSNMEGNAQPETIDRTGVDKRFRLLATCNFSSPSRKMGNWYVATPPLVSPAGGLGPTDYFGRTMVENLPEEVRVGVIPVAMGGSPIEMFDKDKYKQKMQQNPNEWWATLAKQHYGGNPYGRIIEMAKKAQEVGVIKGILLHQGCSNNGDPNWPNMVKKIYTDMLKDLNLGADTVPLFVGETLRQDQGGACYGHNTQVARMPSVVKTSHVISSEGCPGNGKDPWHFNAKGYRMLGRRYAAAALPTVGAHYPYFSFLEGDFKLNTKCAYTEKSRTLTAQAGGSLAWIYSNTADWSDYKYLVVKLKEAQTTDAEINLYKPDKKVGFKEAVGDRTTVAIDLQDLKNGSSTMDASQVYMMLIRCPKAGKLVFDDIFLTNDAQYGNVTGMKHVTDDGGSAAEPIYTLDGRRAESGQQRRGVYIQGGRKIVK